MRKGNIDKALEATIKSNNITVPTQDTNKVMSEILSGMQTWLDTKSHILWTLNKILRFRF